MISPSPITLNKLLAEMLPPNADQLETELIYCLKEIRDLTESISSNQNALEMQKSKIDPLQTSIDRLKNAVLDVDAQRKLLHSLDEWYELVQFNQGEYVIKAITKGIVTQPNYNGIRRYLGRLFIYVYHNSYDIFGHTLDIDRTLTYSNRHHPHVMCDGTFCLGDKGIRISNTLLNRKAYIELLVFLADFLYHPYYETKSWPEYKPTCSPAQETVQ